MDRTSTGAAFARAIGPALLGIAVLLSVGCARPYRVVTNVLDDGRTIHTLANNEIKIEGAAKHYGFEEGSSVVEKRCLLDVRAVDAPGAERTFELLLNYTGANALVIEPGRSLEIVVDLNSHVLSAGSGGTRTRDPSGRYFSESLAYPVSGDLLVAMAEAETVRVIVKGRDGDARGYFDATNFADFRRFVADYARPR